MPSAWFVGDVHGKFHDLMCKKLFQRAEQAVFQLGDMGIFEQKDLNRVPHKKILRFLRGNHDNPELCKKHAQYMGDFGANSDMSMFWVGGAMSTDVHNRTENKDWWRDEQLNTSQCTKALELYESTKPNLVMSHDCPTAIFEKMWPGREKYKSNSPLTNNNTVNLLDMMWLVHKPKYWVFGHHHRTQAANVYECTAVCLDELSEIFINWE